MNLETILGCDSQHAEAIENTFGKCVNKEIRGVELVPSERKGNIVKVLVDDGEIYFLKISSIYFLREIRKDSQSGEIIYQVNY